ncbi:MAG: T9SS type A sorting domain-containing protein [Chitinophagaceae bacterium]
MSASIFIKNKAQSLVLGFVLFFFNTAFSQTNLVPNPSFEQYTICPAATKADKPDYWFKPDLRGAGYCNVCTTHPWTGVPYNVVINDTSYQVPRTGNAYIGMFYLNAIPNARNYYEVQLLDSLKQGQYYYAEYFVSLCNPLRRGCNNQSLLFSKNAVFVDTANSIKILPANPQITNYGNPIVTDTINWVKVSGIFKAQGGEHYLTLGNFKDDANTAFSIVKPTGYYGAAYYVDDVAVYALDSFCLKANAGKDTTIALDDSAFIGSYTNGIDSLKWLNNNTVIDSIRPGFWVKPTASTFYILTQTVNGCTSIDTVYVNVSTVPLKFISYNLIPSLLGTKQSIENLWTTANEINVSHFNIQRSTNTKDYTTIGTQKANNKNYNEYSFTDPLTTNNLPLTLHYRIESVDFDGRKQYSMVQQVNTKHQTSNIVLFPNPAKDYINILANENIKEVKIINQFRQVLEQQIPNTKQITISTKQFAKGLYIVQIIFKDGTTKNEKLIIE